MRKKAILGICSVAALDPDVPKDDDTQAYIWNLICLDKSVRYLNGGFIVPFCLAHFWAQSALQGTIKPDLELIGTLQVLLAANSKEDTDLQVPGPYYDMGAITKWSHRRFLESGYDELEADNHYHRSYFSESLFFLVARRNYKQHCKLVWPALTKFMHVRTRLPRGWQFCMVNCDEAMEEDKQLHFPQTWQDVVRTASAEYIPQVPEILKQKPILLLLYCVFVPYRMDFDVVMWLDRKLARAWY